MKDVIYMLKEEVRYCREMQRKHKDNEEFSRLYGIYKDREKCFRKAIYVLEKAGS